ncbi:MAG: helix-turn-helix transcriptional regulator [Leptospiraceae bacterium]|nr:helix-turn-helix transcriptional regulator [Leptospiraceae bacterium]
MIASNQNITLIAGMAITIFAAVLLFTRPPAERRPGLEFLGLLMLLTLVYPLLHPIFRALDWKLLSSFMGIPLLSGPIFYLYIRRLTVVKTALPWWIYGLLAMVVFLALLPALRGLLTGSIQPAAAPVPVEGLPAPRQNPGQGWGLRPLIDISVTLSFSALIFFRLRRHRQDVQEFHSELSEWKLLGSAYMVLGVFLVTNLFLVVHRIAWRYMEVEPAFNREIHGSAFLFMIFAFSLFLVRQSPVFEPESDAEEEPDSVRPSPQNISNLGDGDIPDSSDDEETAPGFSTDPQGGPPGSALSALSTAPARPTLKEVIPGGEVAAEAEPEPEEHEVQRLRSAIESGRLYLDSDLTLDQLSRILGQSRHRVSYILNRGVNQNFYRYVNGLRVEHAARLLRDPAYANWPVLRIALESGFNSKATFNRLFKEYKGRTPMEWRERAG